MPYGTQQLVVIDPAPGTCDHDLYARIRLEYAEMPGLKLTLRQAARLFNLEIARCDRVLTALVERRTLAIAGGMFVRADAGSRYV